MKLQGQYHFSSQVWPASRLWWFILLQYKRPRHAGGPVIINCLCVQHCAWPWHSRNGNSACPEHLSSLMRKDFIVHCSFITQACERSLVFPRHLQFHFSSPLPRALAEQGWWVWLSPFTALSLICEQPALDLTSKFWPRETRGHSRAALASIISVQQGLSVETDEECGFHVAGESSRKEGGLCRPRCSEPGLTPPALHVRFGVCSWECSGYISLNVSFSFLDCSVFELLVPN